MINQPESSDTPNANELIDTLFAPKIPPRPSAPPPPQRSIGELIGYFIGVMAALCFGVAIAGCVLFGTIWLLEILWSRM